MTVKTKIVLVGMPGSGKSTFGKKLASALHFDFIDLDSFIENKERKTVAEIFQELGEGKFRELESTYLFEILNELDGFVLASGGGTPCFNDNMEVINQSGTSVFLDTDLMEIYHRMSKDEISKRPLFSDLEQNEIILKLKSLYEERFTFYQKAHIRLEANEVEVEHFIAHWIH
jgi:shikimate kinase